MWTLCSIMKPIPIKCIYPPRKMVNEAVLSVTLVLFLNVFSVNCGRLNTDPDELYRRDLTITTSTGVVRGGHGGLTNGKAKDIFRFRSIPFAEPPVGELRFEPPVPKKPWTGTLDARQKPSVCTQGSDPVVGSEDCLYLKIYTTALPKEQKKLPVMLWIYGGAFTSGSADFGDHSIDFLLDEDVILVAFQYRVGVFGFLSTGDSVAPGNAGLKDQILALGWIKENIARFGGDPDRITLFGQSAGATSIAYLLQTNATRGLFNGVIMQSGHSLCQWALTRDAENMARNIATTLNQVAAAQSQTALMNGNPLGGLPIGPVVEPDHAGAIVTGNSHEKLKNGQFHHVPIMIGHTSKEALINSLSAIVRLWLLTFDIQPSKLVPVSLNSNGLLTNNAIGRNIRSHYFQRSVAQSNEELITYISDDQWQRPIQESVLLYSARTPVYYYEFSHIGSLYGVTQRTVQGVGHTEDLGYIFDLGHEGSPADYLVRSRMVKMWTNFAKTGSATPTSDSLLQNVVWTPNRGDTTIRRLEISNNLSVAVNPSAADMNFWRGVFQSRGRSPFSTY
ncbi:hypothetical protein JTB14_009761 [Gonioctena quinquepunctata]|nr:hypothetical protein JTB14_009761 [Gonioctena quinquepunctata]